MESRARLSLLPVVAIIALLLGTMLALAGCSGRFDVGCGDSTSEVKTYTDSDYGYSFEYPAGWVLQRRDMISGSSAKGSVGVYDPSGANAGGYYFDLVQVWTYEVGATFDESMMGEYKTKVEEILANPEGEGSDWTEVMPLSETKVGGMSGFTATYSYIMDGTPAKSRYYFLFTGNIEYELMMQAVTDDWDKNQATFDAIIASFKPEAAE